MSLLENWIPKKLEKCDVKILNSLEYADCHILKENLCSCKAEKMAILSLTKLWPIKIFNTGILTIQILKKSVTIN